MTHVKCDVCMDGFKKRWTDRYEDWKIELDKNLWSPKLKGLNYLPNFFNYNLSPIIASKCELLKNSGWRVDTILMHMLLSGFIIP